MSEVEETAADRRPEAGEETDPGGPRLPGVVYPLLAVVFGGALVWGFSRILLASGKDQAVAIAILMALNILVGSALVAYGRRVRGRPTAFPILVGAAVALVVAGAVTSVVWGDRAPEKAEAAGPKPVAVSLTAKGIAFVQTKLTFPKGAKISMKFDNQDAGTPHNFVLFPGPTASGTPLFTGDAVNGPGTATYAFTAPARPGTYFFHCEFHPQQMTGTVTVVPEGQAGGPPGGGGGPPGGPIQLTAKDVAFSPTKLTASSASVTIHFVNDDANIPHDVAVFNGSDASAPLIAKSDLITGSAATDLTLTLPGPGTYFFHCDVHPTQMTGTITLSG